MAQSPPKWLGFFPLGFGPRARELEKGTKTDNPREVPVHPVLARVLDRWRQEGWARMRGHLPTHEDLIVPSREGEYLRADDVLPRLHHDLRQLGLRPRRTHDARRTFISLAQADGAQPHILKWVTHGRPRDIVSAYTTLPWEALCGEVAKLRVQVSDKEEPTVQSAGCNYAGTTFEAEKEKAPKSRGLGGPLAVSPTGFEPVLPA